MPQGESGGKIRGGGTAVLTAVAKQRVSSAVAMRLIVGRRENLLRP
jgi:hypothetical protein